MRPIFLLVSAAGLGLVFVMSFYDAVDDSGSSLGIGPAVTTTSALPSEYSAHRFLVRPVTSSGDTLRFFTDTGGAGAWVTNDAVERTASRNLFTGNLSSSGDSMFVATWPELRHDAFIPSPAEDDSTLFVFDPRSMPAEMPREVLDWDGMLGYKWFKDRVWTFDYENGVLHYHASPPALDEQHDHTVPLHFGAADGGPMHQAVFDHIPRMQIEVAGEQLNVYFDTGATITLSDSALAVLDDGLPAVRGSSFLSPVVAAKWRSSHPEWRVIERGVREGLDLLEVPTMRIAGHEVGPVWFSIMPSAEPFERISDIAGVDTHAMVGGSAFHHFGRITVDYPNAIALFEK